jgi:2-oxoglutarate ferredoxin oxidoreductase subunit delta
MFRWRSPNINNQIGKRDSKLKKVEFDEERCKGCELCISVCPRKVLALAEYFNGKGFRPATIVKIDECTSCAICASMCPDVVITVRREERKHA